MDGITIIRNYIDRMIQHGSRGGNSNMKVLLLDAVTTQIVSAVYSQTEILKQQVYLVSRIDDKSVTAMRQEKERSSRSNSHMHAICFVRPTSIDLLVQELENGSTAGTTTASSSTASSSSSPPRFAEYSIFFSAPLSSSALRRLAEADRYERVTTVQEFYADFIPVNETLWTLQCRNSLAMTVAAGTSWAPKYVVSYERHLAGLQSLLLATKRQPYCIRYAGHSPCAEELAKDLYESMQSQNDDVFQFRNKSATLLLILDRRDDPVTPLLSQWTYQAMVHELLGLNNHRVLLRGAPGVPKDLEEVVLSSTQDEFFKQNRFKNFGELGEAIQQLLREYQKQTAQTGQLNSIEEMQQFMEKFPELRSRSHVVSKHVAIMGELARLVEVCSLMDVSQLEQELACADDHNAHWRECMEKLNSPNIKIPDKLRLGLLYALRYEISGNIHRVQSAMAKGGVPPDMVNLVSVMLRYAGMKSRGPGLFGDPEHNNLMSKMTKSFMSSVQGVQNVYAQHVPLLMDTIQSVMRGKLSTRTHPLVPGSATRAQAEMIVPDEIIIFMVGGITYEEGTKIHEFNEQMKGRSVRVVLAGSTVHNSTSFLDELKATSL